MSVREDGMLAEKIGSRLPYEPITKVSVPGNWRRRAEQGLRLHAEFAALTIVAVSFVIVLAAARSRYFTPDEALHFEMANMPGPIDVYRKTLNNAHPPLFFLLLHAWLRLGRSELFLRVLPALLGGAFLWCAYRWASRLFGSTAGFLTVVVLAFSPACLPLSAELRGYSLLLLMSAAALAEFESAVSARSPRRMALFSVLLYLAILTHYSALFVTLSLFAYAVIRLSTGRLPRKLVGTWAGFQAGAAALYTFLYFSHVAGLHGGDMERGAITSWLHSGYFQQGQEGAGWFALRQLRALSGYFFGSPRAAVVASFLAVAGVVILAARRLASAVVLVVPCVLGLAAGLLDLYPFSETRHSAYLLPFVSAAIGVALSALCAGRFWSALLVTGVISLSWRTPVWMAPARSLSRMNLAVEQLRGVVQPGNLIFTDSRLGSVLRYYLGRNELSTETYVPERFWESSAGSYCLIASPLWEPGAKAFVDEAERMIQVYGGSVGQHFWVAHLGSVGDPTMELVRRFDGTVVRKGIGDLSLFEVWRPGE